MICCILAAGYATRLYPLTKNFPKPLLAVNGKPIIDWLVDDVDAACGVRGFIVVTNHRYIGHFEKWAREKRLSAPLKLIDDGTLSNETRLGAVRDVQLAIDILKTPDDLLVLAGDNVLDFSLSKFAKFARDKGASAIMRYREGDVNKLRKCGVMTVDSDELITRMEEKPENPFSNWCAPPFYVYHKNDLRFVKEAIENGCNTDAPGSFMAYLAGKTRVYAMEMPGKRYDIGDIKSYESVISEYKGIRGA